MIVPRRFRSPGRSFVVTVLAFVAAWWASPLRAQTLEEGPPPAGPASPSPYEGRLIAEVRLVGLERVPERFVDNNVRTVAGRPLSWETVRDDLRRLERLGEFNRVEAEAQLNDDMTVDVIFRLVEAPIVEDIAWVGNREINDDQIAEAVNRTGFISGVPIDDFRIRQTQRAIEGLYRDKGFFSVEVAVDRSELESERIVIFRIREGERTQVTAIRFRGNDAFPASQLRPEIETKKKFLFFSAPLDEETLEADVASLIRFYQDRGYLDVRADRRIQISPNGKEAIVTFLLEEGPIYTLREVFVRAEDEEAGIRVFSPDQIRGLLPLKPGDVYRGRDVRASVEAAEGAYKKIGYVDARVGRTELRAAETPQLDLVLTVREGERFRTGLVLTGGHDLTKRKVILRETEVRPGHWLDATDAEATERRLRELGLFEVSPFSRRGDPPNVTIQPEDPENPGYRDVLIEVTETNTGALSFGAAVDSDFGLAGLVSLEQRNFDIADTPDSLDELIRGRAFRGAGQRFQIRLQPGTEQSLYSIGLTEPALFETAYSLDGSAFFRTREFSDFDEERFGGRFALGRRFGTRWQGNLFVRAESVDVSNIEPSSSVDLFEVEGQNALTSLGFQLQRRTADSRLRPTTGTATQITVQQYGALGGDYDFTSIEVEHDVFLTIARDDFGRATVLSLDLRAGWIPQEDESPIFERYFLGGRSFRGFEFRGIGPVGVRNDTGLPGDDKVGGDFLFFAGAQVERPVWQDIFSVVAFDDSGTINEEVDLNPYRLSVGAGVRLYLPQFGQAPLAFDFGFPLLKEDTDDTQLFSFSVDIPF